jgi:hypothetical protein
VTAKPTSSKPAAVGERIYTLTPTSMVFQVAEARVLSAEGAFKVGDIVKQKMAMLNSGVEKRYVVDGKVGYDTKDELETVVENLGKDGEGGVDGLVKAEQGAYWPVGQRRS